jgi:hypothetical protein
MEIQRSDRIEIRITRECAEIIELTLYPSLGKRGTYPLPPAKGGEKESGNEFNMTYLVK